MSTARAIEKMYEKKKPKEPVTKWQMRTMTMAPR